MKFKKYFYQYKADDPKAEQYILGQQKEGSFYDLYYTRAGKASEWLKWVQPVEFDGAEAEFDEAHGWTMKELTKDEVFLMVL